MAPLAVKVGVVPAQTFDPDEDDTDIDGVVSTVLLKPFDVAVSPHASTETVIVLEDKDEEV